MTTAWTRSGRVELHEDVGDVRLDGGFAEQERLCDFRVGEAARNHSERLDSRGVSSLSGGGMPLCGAGRLANWPIRRRVTDGASSASPSATVWIAWIGCSGGASLSRKPPVAPAL